MTSLLLTGGAGYIGSHVCKLLLKKGYNVTVLDNLSTGHKKAIDKLHSISINFTFKECDLKDYGAVEDIIKNGKFDCVFHFAASIVVSESVSNPLKYYLNNTLNTTNLISLSIKYGVKNFIFSSTAAIYGDSHITPLTEDVPPNPINPYGFSKYFSERVLIDSANANKSFNYVILRYFNVAGADVEEDLGQNTKNATHLIKVGTQTALGRREHMDIYGDDYDTPDGTCIRDFIHINDLSSAHISAYEYLLKGSGSDIFNVGYAKGYSVKEVIECIKSISGVNFKINISKRRDGDSKIVISSNRKILQNTNWKIEHDNLELIIKSALNWERGI